MSRSNHRRAQNKAVALQYGAKDQAPVVVASGMGYMAEKIIDVATENGVPVYEDNSLSTILSRLELGQEIPPELYQAVVEIYVYFLHFDPNARAQPPAEKNEAAQAEEEAKQPEEEAKQAEEEVPNESTE